jgi:predicted Na+-dependent transporter
LVFSFVLCIIIYSLAWLLGGLFKQPLDVKTALFFGHGCKNLGSGLMLAAQLFPGSPAALVPLVVATLFQQPLGAIIIKIISRKGEKNG